MKKRKMSNKKKGKSSKNKKGKGHKAKKNDRSKSREDCDHHHHHAASVKDPYQMKIMENYKRIAGIALLATATAATIGGAIL